MPQMCLEILFLGDRGHQKKPPQSIKGNLDFYHGRKELIEITHKVFAHADMIGRIHPNRILDSKQEFNIWMFFYKITPYTFKIRTIVTEIFPLIASVLCVGRFMVVVVVVVMNMRSTTCIQRLQHVNMHHVKQKCQRWMSSKSLYWVSKH